MGDGASPVSQKSYCFCSGDVIKRYQLLPPPVNLLLLDMDEKLDMRRQYELTVQKATGCTLGCIKGSMGSRWREVFHPLCFVLVTPPLEHCVHLWSPQRKKDVDLLEQARG